MFKLSGGKLLQQVTNTFTPFRLVTSFDNVLTIFFPFFLRERDVNKERISLIIYSNFATMTLYRLVVITTTHVAVQLIRDIANYEIVLPSKGSNKEEVASNCLESFTDGWLVSHKFRAFLEQWE